MPRPTRRDLLAALASLAVTERSYAITSTPPCSVWVFGLLHPTKLNIYPQAEGRLHYAAASGSGIVEGQSCFSINAADAPISVSGPHGSAAPMILEVPGVMRRAFFGTLQVRSRNGILIPVVFMSRELAVSSIVGAELPVDATPFHALAAQAIAARSFLAATQQPRHQEAYFCDTTHCQFLRSPAPMGSTTAQAVLSTAGFVLSCKATAIAARYSAACGGHTDSRLEEAYLYQSVKCESCRNGRLLRRGHGLGLCQAGAIGLARAGAHWRDILAKYYPGAMVQSSDRS